MTTAGDALVEFLLARYAEDEAVAKAALGEPSYEHYGDTAAEESWAMAKSEGCAPEGYRFHREFDPARVLAWCEANRRIVERHSYGPILQDDCHWTFENVGPDRPCPTLRLLALPYAGHPHYREEWKP